MSLSMGLGLSDNIPYMRWKIKNVWNHQRGYDGISQSGALRFAVAPPQTLWTAWSLPGGTESQWIWGKNHRWHVTPDVLVCPVDFPFKRFLTKMNDSERSLQRRIIHTHTHTLRNTFPVAWDRLKDATQTICTWPKSLSNKTYPVIKRDLLEAPHL